MSAILWAIVTGVGAVLSFVFWVAIRAALSAIFKEGIKHWWRTRKERNGQSGS